MVKRKTLVVLSDSDSDVEEKKSPLKSKKRKMDSSDEEEVKSPVRRKKQKIEKEREEKKKTPQKRNKKEPKILIPDSEEEEEESTSPRGQRQLSLEQAFNRGAKKSPPKVGTKKLPAQKNTLDRYFSKGKEETGHKEKISVSVDTFFSSAAAPTTSVKSKGDTKKTEKKKDEEEDNKLEQKEEVKKSPEKKVSVETPKSPVHPLVSKVVHQSQVGSPARKVMRLDDSVIPSTPPSSKSKLVLKEKTVPEVSPTGRKENEPVKDGDSKTPDTATRRSSYVSFVNREGPRALGTKDIPQGRAGCLSGVTIVVTGVLEACERDDVKALVDRCGGRLTTSISKKTSYLVVGREPGEGKLAKADQFKTKQLDEDAFYQMIRDKSGEGKDSSTKKVTRKEDPLPNTTTSSSSPYFSQQATTSHASPTKLTAKPIVSDKRRGDVDRKETTKEAVPGPREKDVPLARKTSNELWVEKYRPKTMKQLIGQHGAASPANKLNHWLGAWHTAYASGKKAKAYGGPLRFNDDGSSYRSVLLSGPPGIGKTTAALVVANELGFSTVELNASSTRSKRSLKEEVAQALGTHSLQDMFGQQLSHSDPSLLGKRHLLIMDEVDGMAGNEDRGGMQELIQLIKSTRIPIICICNDRQSQKVRSLANYCLDLRFQRPRAEQIKAAILSIACKEGIQVPQSAITEIITSSNHDIRQILNNLEMWSATSLTEGQMKKDALSAQKDLKIGPFEVIRKVFLPDPGATIMDKSDLFFQDYSFGPLFVQENYLQVRPQAAKGDPKKTLLLVSKAADSIALGDLVSKKIRQNNSWGLLPVQAIFSSVLPGEYMRGPLGGQIQFPSWLGKNSSAGKTWRQTHELTNHLRLATRGSADSTAVVTDYAQALADRLTRPLREGDVQSVLDSLDTYQLLRDDIDTLLEVTKWPNSQDRMAGVDSKTKAALTRAYNKGSHLTPYAISGGVKKKAAGASLEEGDDLEDEAQEEEEDDDGLDKDAMIVKKKPKKETASKGKKETAGSSKSKKTVSDDSPSKARGGKGKGRKQK